MPDEADFPVRIREAKACDLPELLKLYRQLNNSSMEDFTLEQAEILFLRIGNYPDYRIYLAKHKDQVVGTFALLIMESLGHRGIPSAILEDVVVSEECRGAGVGRQMISFATSAAKRSGCSKLFFSSGLHRREAHQFYENLGFLQHGYSYHLNLSTESSDNE